MAGVENKQEAEIEQMKISYHRLPHSFDIEKEAPQTKKGINQFGENLEEKYPKQIGYY